MKSRRWHHQSLRQLVLLVLHLSLYQFIIEYAYFGLFFLLSKSVSKNPFFLTLFRAVPHKSVKESADTKNKSFPDYGYNLVPLNC